MNEEDEEENRRGIRFTRTPSSSHLGEQLTLGEIAASSKGEEYVLTYYKKLREERAEYYRKRYRKHSHLR